MEDLFIISLIIVCLLGGIIWYAYKHDKQRTRLLDEIDEREPHIDDTQAFSDLFQQELQQQTIDSDQMDLDAEPVVNLSDAIKQINDVDTTPDIDLATVVADPESSLIKNIEPTDNREAEKASPVSKPREWEMIIAFTIMAREGRQFSGKSIKAVFESLDLHFGDLQIFHRYVPGSRTQTLFSIANILEPGTLNPDSFATMTTPGLLIFSRLPGPVNGLAVFDDLLETAQTMADKLDGVLSDESRKEISQASIEAMRNRILNLNMQLQAEQTQYDNDNTF